MKNARSPLEELADLVGYYGLLSVYPRLASWAKLPPDALWRSTPSRWMRLASPERGLSLELEYVLGEKGRRLPWGWALRELVVEGPANAAPFGLDPVNETPESARQKLSEDVAGGRAVDRSRGDLRVTHFLDDDRAVEIRFAPSWVGFDRVWVVRLGDARDLRGIAPDEPASPGSAEGAAP